MVPPLLDELLLEELLLDELEELLLEELDELLLEELLLEELDELLLEELLLDELGPLDELELGPLEELGPPPPPPGPAWILGPWLLKTDALVSAEENTKAITNKETDNIARICWHLLSLLFIFISFFHGEYPLTQD